MDSGGRNKFIVFGLLTAVGGGIVCYMMLRRRKKDRTSNEEATGERTEVHDGEGDAIAEKDKDVLVLGLEGSGKTALLEGLSGHSHSSSKPTEGFNIVSLPGAFENRHNLIELGGGAKPRQYWRHFFTDKALLLFVVDASQPSMFSDAKLVLHELLNEPHLSNVRVVLVAHKQDREGAVDADQLLRIMDLKSFTTQGRNIYPVQTQTPPNGQTLGTKELGNIINSLITTKKAY